MDPSVVSNLYAALEAVYDPKTTDIIRKGANTYLDDFKKNFPPLTVINTSINLLQQQNSKPEIKYYGLQAFEYVVLQNWNIVSFEDRTLIKAQLTQLLLSPLTDISTSSSKLILTKLAIVAAEIAKRDWPQLWPEFFPLLQSLIQANDEKTEKETGFRINPHGIFVVLTILYELYNSAFQPSISLPERRRHELQLGVVQHRTELTSLFSYLLETCCIAFGRVGTIQHPTYRSIISINMKTVLQTFSTLIDNTPFELLLQNNLCLALCQLVTIPETSEEAHEIVMTLLCKKLPGWNEKPEELLKIWSAILEFAKTVLQPNVLNMIGIEQQITYLLKTSRALKVLLTTYTDIGLKNQRYWNISKNNGGSGSNTTIDPAIQAYPQMVSSIIQNTIDVLGAMLQVNSLQVTTETYLCWTDIFRLHAEVFLSNRGNHQGLIQTLFVCVFQHCKNRKFEDYLHEFDDPAQYQRATSGLKVQTLTLAQQLTLLHPVEMVKNIAQKTHEAFSTLSQIQDENILMSPSSKSQHHAATISGAGVGVGNTTTDQNNDDNYATLPLTCTLFDPKCNAIIAPFVNGSKAMDAPAFLDAEVCSTLLDHIMKTVETLVIPLELSEFPQPLRSYGYDEPTFQQAMTQAKVYHTDLLIAIYSPPGTQLTKEEVYNYRTELISVTEGLITHLAQFKHRELGFWTPKFRSIASCIPVLAASESAMKAFIEIALEQVQFNPNNCVFGGAQTASTSSTSSPGSNILEQEDILQPCPMIIEDLRRRGSYTLLTLANKCPKAFTPVYNNLVQATRSLFSRGLLAPSEHIYIYIILLTLSLEIASKEEQLRLIPELLEDSMKTICSPEVHEVLQSTESFVSFIGNNPLEQELFLKQQQLLIEAGGFHGNASNNSGSNIGNTLRTGSNVPYIKNLSKEYALRGRVYHALDKLSSFLKILTANKAVSKSPQGNIFRLVSLPSTAKTNVLKLTNDPPNFEPAMLAQTFAKAAGTGAGAIGSGIETSTTSTSTLTSSPTPSSSPSTNNPYGAETPGGSTAPTHPILLEILPLILPFIRTFIIRINEICSEQIIELLPPTMHALASPSYSHLLWTLKHDFVPNASTSSTFNHGKDANVPDRRRLLIRDITTWKEQSFEFSCQILASATNCGHIFYNSVAQEMYQVAVSNVNNNSRVNHSWIELFASFSSVFPTPLRVFMTKFLSTFLLRCPLHLYESVLSPVVQGIHSIVIRLLSSAWVSWKKQHHLPLALQVKSYGSMLLRLRGLNRKMTSANGGGSANADVSGTAAAAAGDSETLMFKKLTSASGKYISANTSQSDQDLEILDDAEMFALTEQIAKLLYPVLEISIHHQKVFDRYLTATTVTAVAMANAAAAQPQHPYYTPPAPIVRGPCETIVSIPTLCKSIIITMGCILSFQNDNASKIATKCIRRLLPTILQLHQTFSDVYNQEILSDLRDVLTVSFRLIIDSFLVSAGGSGTSGGGGGGIATNTSTSSGNNGANVSTFTQNSPTTFDEEATQIPRILDEGFIDELCFLIRDAFVFLANTSIPQNVLREQCNATEDQIQSLMELLRTGNMIEKRGRMLFRTFLQKLIEEQMQKQDDGSGSGGNRRKIMNLPPAISSMLLDSYRQAKLQLKADGKKSFDYSSAIDLFAKK